MKRFRPSVIMLLACIAFVRSHAQDKDADTSQTTAVNVYLDCDFCDADYIRTEITWVNYVRDRLLADVHVLVATRGTASGGTEYTLSFVGRENNACLNDTLIFTTKQSDTEEMQRTAFAHMLKLGLIRYAARTPVAAKLHVSFDRQAEAPVQVADTWNYWVYKLNLNGFASGEQLTRSLWVNGGISASRTTDDWKYGFSLNTNYNQNSYKYTVMTPSGAEPRTVKSITRSHYFNSLLVRSLGDHWSIGGYASSSTSTYSNTKFSWRVAPAIEYNLFPYSESTHQELRFQYSVAFRSVRYYEVTIFEKTQEMRFNHSLSAALKLRHIWGTVGLMLEGSHYLHDINKRSLSLSGYVSLRIIEGLSLRLDGGYMKINDQLFLQKGGATPEEVLLRQRQLATDYQYWVSYGLSYTFGAIYNNIVNPRFGSSD